MRDLVRSETGNLPPSQLTERIQAEDVPVQWGDPPSHFGIWLALHSGTLLKIAAVCTLVFVALVFFLKATGCGQ